MLKWFYDPLNHNREGWNEHVFVVMTWISIIRLQIVGNKKLLNFLFHFLPSCFKSNSLFSSKHVLLFCLFGMKPSSWHMYIFFLKSLNIQLSNFNVKLCSINIVSCNNYQNYCDWIIFHNKWKCFIIIYSMLFKIPLCHHFCLVSYNFIVRVDVKQNTHLHINITFFL